MKSNILSILEFIFRLIAKHGRTPPTFFSLALLTNSNLSELESAWNSCKNWSANVFTLEQVTTFEEIRPVIFCLDVNDDVNLKH